MKANVMFLLVSVLLIGLAGAVWGQSTISIVDVMPGDVNSDGVVNIIDAMKVAQFAGSLSVEIDRNAADVNGSGSIDIIDALAIAQYTAGLIPNLIRLITGAGYPGMQLIITGLNFDPTGNEIRFADRKPSILYYSSVKADSADGKHLTFTIPTYTHAYCYYDPMPCAAPDRAVGVGMYYVSVITSKGESLAYAFVIPE